MERRLAAIFAADVLGYSRLMGEAEEATHHRVGDELSRVRREVDRSGGRVFSVAGDGVMAEFPSAVQALKCAMRVQAESGRRSAMVAEGTEQIMFRIGLHVGEVVVEGERIGGTTVNVAARLEALAEPGGITLSETVLNQVRRAVAADYQFLGRPALKNIRDPVPVYGISRASCANWVGVPAIQRPAARAGERIVMSDYRPSLAVLPFRTLHGSEEDRYLAEGIIDDVIHALGGLQDLVVVARSSVQEFARSPLDLARIGQALDVRYVIHGSVRQVPTGLRTTVELDEVESGTVVWVDRLDTKADAVFELQDRIALRVAQSLAPHLRQREVERVARKPPDSLTAFDLTLRALELFNGGDRAALERAGALLRQAIAADPGYGHAYSHLAALHMRLIGQGWSADWEADSRTACAHAVSALERDGNNAVALAIYGHIQAYLFRQFETAMDYLERALIAGPSCALAWGFSSLVRGYVGEPERAVEQGEWALRLCPIGPDVGRFAHYLSQAYYLAGRYSEAVVLGRKCAAETPAHASNLRSLIASLVAAGEQAEAKHFVGKLMALVPEFRLTTFLLRTPLQSSAAGVFAERLRRAGVPD